MACKILLNQRKITILTIKVPAAVNRIRKSPKKSYGSPLVPGWRRDLFFLPHFLYPSFPYLFPLRLENIETAWVLFEKLACNGLSGHKHHQARTGSSVALARMEDPVERRTDCGERSQTQGISLLLCRCAAHHLLEEARPLVRWEGRQLEQGFFLHLFQKIVVFFVCYVGKLFGRKIPILGCFSFIGSVFLPIFFFNIRRACGF